jgi:hypothetical protein
VSAFTFENVPLGALHVELVALPPIVPAKFIKLPAQTVCGFPAFAVAAAFKVITTVEVAAEQGPVPSGSFVVSVNVTVPLVMEGVYVEVSEFTLENIPLEALHVELDALPPIVPDKFTEPPAQTVCAFPAFAVAGLAHEQLLTVITTVEAATPQGPEGSFVVSVNVTVPLVIEGV